MFKYKYYDRTTAPMLFHKILCYLILPFSVVASLGDISSFIANESTLTPGWYAFCLLIDSILVVITIITAVGLIQWKEFGWYALYVNVFFRIGFYIIMIFCAWWFRVGNVASVLGELLAIILVMGPILLYYLHRRPLFVKSVQAEGLREKSIYSISNESQSENTQSGNDVSITTESIETLDIENDVKKESSIDSDKRNNNVDSEISPSGYYFANRDEFVIYVMAEKPDNDIQWLIGDNYHELYQKGYELYEEGNFAEAVKVLNSSLTYNPVAIDARFELISCYFSLKEYEPALGTLRYLERYLGRKKDLAHYYRCLGYYYVEMNDYERAAAAYSMSLNYDRHRIALGELEGITRIHGIDPDKLDVKALLTSDGIPVLNPWYEESNSEIGTNKNTDIRCPACNRNLPADSIFCPFCGVKLE